MYGAIIGDIVGSPSEFAPRKTKEFEFFSPWQSNFPDFTDDTVLTIAVANTLMTGMPYVDSLHHFVRLEPHNRGYGTNFGQWVSNGEREPYNSYGNGSAMRVSPVAWYHDNLQDVLDEAVKSAEVTHNHPEGIKGAQATALAIYLARIGHDKETIKLEIESRFGYDLDRSYGEIQLFYSFDVTCQGSVPEAIICFLVADSFEDTIRNAVALGGDADTQACIAGSIAEAYWKDVPQNYIDTALGMLSKPIREVAVDFYDKHVNPKM